MDDILSTNAQIILNQSELMNLTNEINHLTLKGYVKQTDYLYKFGKQLRTSINLHALISQSHAKSLSKLE